MRIDFKHFRHQKNIITAVLVLLLGAMLTACGGGGGGGGDPEPPPVVAKSLTVVADDSVSSNDPNVVVHGKDASIQYWADPISQIVQQSYFESSDASIKVRVNYDANGAPTRIEDEVTGNFVQIVSNGTDRVDYLEYDAQGNYLSGNAVFISGEKIYRARITGRPAISDGQISGILHDSGDSTNGSYSLIAQNSGAAGLADITEADAATYAALEKLLMSSENIQGRSLVPVLSTLRDVLPTAGLILVVGAASTVLAPAYGAAGVCMIASGLFAGKLDQWVDNKFNAGGGEAQEAVDTSLETLVDSAKTNVGNFWSRVKSRLSDSTTYTNSVVEDAKSNSDLLNSLSDYDGNTSSREPTSLPPTDGPDPISTPVTGQAAFQDGSIYDLNGTVDSDGKIVANGDGLNTAAGSSTVSIDANISNDVVSGQFDSSSGISGTVDGKASPLGVCQTSAGSGGEGAYTYSHYVGAGSGTVSFFYDSYSIPDAFTVSTSSGVKFATPGLVSGSNTVSVAMTGEKVVFISVTAPNSGTAWKYSLGCIQ